MKLWNKKKEIKEVDIKGMKEGKYAIICKDIH